MTPPGMINPDKMKMQALVEILKKMDHPHSNNSALGWRKVDTIGSD